MIERRIYDASLPLYAAWSLESPIYSGVAFIQISGNENRLIASRQWKLKALHTCIEDAAAMLHTLKWTVRTHITPPDQDNVFLAQFEDQGLACESAPVIHELTTLTRRLLAVLTIEPDTNEELIEAIRQYAPRDDKKGGFVVADGHKPERFFVKTLEVFAAWQHEGNGRPADDWGRAPNYSQTDRARI